MINDLEDKMLEMWQAGKSNDEIATATGYAIASVPTILHRIRIRRGIPTPKEKSRITDGMINYAMNALLSGKRQVDIARELGIAQGTLSAHITNVKNNLSKVVEVKPNYANEVYK